MSCLKLKEKKGAGGLEVDENVGKKLSQNRGENGKLKREQGIDKGTHRKAAQPQYGKG